MTQGIRKATTEAEQAHPRQERERAGDRFRLNGWIVAKYAVLTVVGVLLYRAGAAFALAERGYRAVGGEVFALFLPVLYYEIAACVRDYIKKQEEQDK